MQCITSYGPKDYRYEQAYIPSELKPAEILIKVTRVGICAGDTKCYLGAPLFYDTTEFGESYNEPPVRPGHEFIGNVVALGDGAAEKYGLSIGDQAIAENIVPCGCCEMCLDGDYNVCMPANTKPTSRYGRQPHNIYGFRQMCHGGMANYMKYVQGSIIHKVPHSIPAKQAVYIEPLSCGIHAVNRANIQLKDVVVISGAGAVGLAAVCAARMKNPKLLIVLDLNDDRLQVAKKCGADEIFNPLKTDIIDIVMQATNGYGCHKYIEATGAPPSVAQGLKLLRRKGTFVEYSVFKEDVLVNMTTISDSKELDVLGGHCGPGCYPIAISMLEKGLVPVEDIITHEISMSDFKRAFWLVDGEIDYDGKTDKKPFSIKVTLDPEN